MSIFRSVQILDGLDVSTERKGEIIIHSGTENVGLAAANKYILPADSNIKTGLKQAAVNNYGIVDFAQYSLVTLPISTNSTTPISLTQFEHVPASGNYLIMYDLIFSMSNTKRVTTFGIYRDDTLIASSKREVEGYSNNKKMPYCSQFYTNFSGSQTLKLKFNTSHTDNSTTLHQGNLIIFKISDVAQLES